MFRHLKLKFGIRSLLGLVATVAIMCIVFRTFFPPLPTKEDFAPQNTIHAQYAWKVFGDCSIAEAKMVLDECPDVHIDEFMWMGDRAFAFYFPVMEAHVMEPCKQRCEFKHNRSEWVASIVSGHFWDENSPEIVSLAPRVVDLASFVLENVDEIKCEDYERGRIKEAWTSLKQEAESAAIQDQEPSVEAPLVDAQPPLVPRTMS